MSYLKPVALLLETAAKSFLARPPRYRSRNGLIDSFQLLSAYICRIPAVAARSSADRWTTCRSSFRRGPFPGLRGPLPFEALSVLFGSPCGQEAQGSVTEKRREVKEPWGLRGCGRKTKTQQRFPAPQFAQVEVPPVRPWHFIAPLDDVLGFLFQLGARLGS